MGIGYDDFLYGKTRQVLLSHFVSNTWFQFGYFNVVQVLSSIHYVYTFYDGAGRTHAGPAWILVEFLFHPGTV